MTEATGHPGMAQCPECDARFESESDVAFEDIELDRKWLRLQAAKRFYVTACNECGAVVGAGVAAP